MTASSSPRMAGDMGTSDRPGFLASHRALAVCTRELTRVSDAIVAGTEALAAQGLVEKPVAKVSPGRTIIQLGPVAVTIAWLRSTLDTVAEGQLLAIVWRGVLAPRNARRPETLNSAARTTAAPAPLLEETLVAAGDDEASWRWTLGADMPTYTSAELAARYVELLHKAYATESAAV